MPSQEIVYSRLFHELSVISIALRDQDVGVGGVGRALCVISNGLASGTYRSIFISSILSASAFLGLLGRLDRPLFSILFYYNLDRNQIHGSLNAKTISSKKIKVLSKAT